MYNTLSLLSNENRKRESSHQKRRMFGETARQVAIQYVIAQFSYGPSSRTLETLFDYFRRSFKSSSTEDFRKKYEHFSYKLPVLAGFLMQKQVSEGELFRGE